MIIPNPYLLIGSGKMGGAMLRAWQRQGPISITVIDPASPSPDLANIPGVTWLATPDRIPTSFQPEAIILAIKPQQMASTLPLYARFKSSVFLSIAAGQTLAHITKLLGGDKYAIVRSMPNLPASIGAGVTVAVANQNVTPAQHALCKKLLRAVGDVIWTEDESLLNAVTALSGSGPAYVFALVEAMTAAGEKLGLPAAFAAQLARQTIIGSGALLAQSSESADYLRQSVTSPGGTTEAALKHLLAANCGLPNLMERAMHAATARAKELAE